jgi:hypothetical protein
MPRGRDWTGEVYGRLTVIAKGSMQGGNRKFLCRCDCGRELEVFRTSLSMGWTQSCGCLLAETRKQPKPRPAPKGTTDELWTVWRNMISRCTNPKASGYAGCGARGITVCDRWREDFWAFKADVGERPTGMVLGRKDTSKGFDSDNCAWMTTIEFAAIAQPRELIRCGDEEMTLAEWARAVGLPIEVVVSRRRLGWSLMAALTTPVKAPGSGG